MKTVIATGPLPRGDLYVIQEIPFTMTYNSDDRAFVSDSLFHMYGTGRTLTEAIADLVTSLEVYFDIMEEDRIRNDAAKAHFDYVSAFIRRTESPST